MQLFDKLLSPFPYTRGFVKESSFAFKSCILMTLVLVILRPFGLAGASLSMITYLGLVAFISALFNVSGSLFVFRKFINEAKWCVWKEVVRALIYYLSML